MGGNACAHNAGANDTDATDAVLRHEDLVKAVVKSKKVSGSSDRAPGQPSGAEV
jgi:hypothetical protein